MKREVNAVPGKGDGGHAGQLAEQLRDLRERAGRPSFRVMAGRSGRISHTTLHEAAAGHRLPSWETTREFVRACGADETEWRARWERAQPNTPGADRTPGAPVRPDRAHPAPPDPSPSDADRAEITSAAVIPAARTTVDGGPAVAAVRAEQTTAVAPARDGLGQERRSILWAAATVLVVLTAVALVQVIGADHNPPAATAGGPVAAHDATPSSPASGDPSAPLIPGDASRFVADVTVPDGSHYRVNEEFTKVWSIANTGTVGWHGRYLVPKDPPRNGDGTECRYPHRVPIGDTLPGEQVHISVRVVAARKPGVCWVGWKMVDAQGRMFFPSRRPVFFLVNVDR
ncbi:NBR1-Ig-like domain-containing protein [Krasilnikovia sp. M28-CT-15]|uniref:NBR1-Ig-like domain-containing protein n=1 Tax=Krasilnikovia sp. M28-CT-15 TaxID=3373540 RepID=UPI0038762CCD